LRQGAAARLFIEDEDLLPFFFVVQLFDLIPELPQQAARQILGTLGVAAILFGNVVALRQARLKVYFGYSTAAQIG